MSARVAQSVRRGFGRISAIFLVLGLAVIVICLGVSAYGALTRPAAENDLVEWRRYQDTRKETQGGPWTTYRLEYCRQLMASNDYKDYENKRKMELGYGWPTIYKCDPDAEPAIRARIARKYQEQWLEPLQVAGISGVIAAFLAGFSWMLGWIIAGFIPD